MEHNEMQDNLNRVQQAHVRASAIRGAVRAARDAAEELGTAAAWEEVIIITETGQVELGECQAIVDDASRRLQQPE